MRPQHAIGLTTIAALAATAASATEHIQLVERALTDATVDLGTPGGLYPRPPKQMYFVSR
jgi:hypothetical protein